MYVHVLFTSQPPQERDHNAPRATEMHPMGLNLLQVRVLISFLSSHFFWPNSLKPFQKAQPPLPKRTYCNVAKFCSKSQANQPEEHQGSATTSARRKGTSTAELRLAAPPETQRQAFLPSRFWEGNRGTEVEGPHQGCGD